MFLMGGLPYMISSPFMSLALKKVKSKNDNKNQYDF